ncbi:hypothetical protein HJC23_011012 [Cyclotella cryptica]|uniref:Uncharacterized protein n=1 Tax=Cyclotella cryptica TaxID=29204 RepID=A0ABD3PF98_9STRA
MKSNEPKAFFVGESQQAHLLLKPLVEQCTIIGHIGDSAACAHYGIMNQRAIEFAITQTFAEGVNLQKDTAFYENRNLGRILNNWNDEKLKLHS